MREMSIDIETYSSEDLTKTGVYRYSEAPDFEILLFAYAFDDDDTVHQIDLAFQSLVNRQNQMENAPETFRNRIWKSGKLIRSITSRT